MLIKELITEIKGFIPSHLLVDTQIDEQLLEELHHQFQDRGYQFEEYHSTLIAIGLLSLYIYCHRQINEGMNHDHLSTFILKGDYFYGLYYQYCSNEAFHFIHLGFAQQLKKAEIISLAASGYPSLIQEVLNLVEEEVTQHELLV